jgi:hypothetical protein
VEELQSRMSSREFVLWQTRYADTPFGTEWDNIRIAAVSANITAATTGKKQKIEDHIPRSKKRKRQSVKEQFAIVQRVKSELQKGK